MLQNLNANVAIDNKSGNRRTQNPSTLYVCDFVKLFKVLDDLPVVLLDSFGEPQQTVSVFSSMKCPSIHSYFRVS
jgi:hypothetical protein